jgi:ParB-like chromosome segregation protein Spo0J
MPLIPIQQIRIGEFIENCRSRERAEAIDPEFIQSLLQNGLINPVEVRPIRQRVDGQKVEFYDLTAGERRVRHIQFILTNFLEDFKGKFSEEGNGYKLYWDGKEAFIEASFFKGTDTEAQIRNLEENRRRADLLPTELARGVLLIRQKGGTYEDAASVIGKSKKAVTDLHEWFLNSTAELKKATDEGIVSLERSKELSECSPSEQRTVVEQVRQIIATNPSRKEAGDQVRLVIDQTTGKTNKPAPVVGFTPASTITVEDSPVNPTINGNGAPKNGKPTNGALRGTPRTPAGIRTLITQLEDKIDQCHKTFDQSDLEDFDRQHLVEDLARFQGGQEAFLFVLGELNEISYLA